MQPHWQATKICALATLGDAVIMVTAYAIAAAAVRSRRWVLDPGRVALAVFIASGLIITVLAELLATGPLRRWQYSSLMPMSPIPEVGLVPLLQWVIVPLLTVWFVRRQLT